MKIRVVSPFGREKLCCRVSVSGENVVVDNLEEKLSMVFYKAFEQDFDESIGFPPMRVRAKKGSLGAILAAAQWLRNLGFVVLEDTDEKTEV